MSENIGWACYFAVTCFDKPYSSRAKEIKAEWGGSFCGLYLLPFYHLSLGL